MKIFKPNRQDQVRIYKKLRKGWFRIVNFFFLNPLTLYILRKISLYGFGSNKCLEAGFLPLPVHYYSPVPDIHELQTRKVWSTKSRMIGINFMAQKQLDLLKELGRKYGSECQWSFKPTKNQAEFYLDNNGFSFGCAASLYSMIREFKPRQIIEIGSGSSSKIIAQAIKANQAKCTYTIIDPYPGSYITNKKVKHHRLIRKRVELLDPKVFSSLKKNDILFIDSSHSVKIGSDVNYLYLDILPRLKPGVIIHIHDIALPYEYAETYFTSEEVRQLWTEQYLLQAFLACNPDYKILMGLAFIQTDHNEVFKKVFPHYHPEIHKLTSGSFWIQRKD